MSLGILLVSYTPALTAALIYRRLLTKTPPALTNVTLTAASTFTVEAAFIRAGRAGLAQLERAADACGRDAGGSLDPDVVENALVRRGFAHERQTKRKLARACPVLIAYAVAILIAAALTNTATIDAGFFAVIAMGAVAMVTYLGPSTALGRRALAVRRAAYPLRAVATVDPLEAVALYGGTIRRKRDTRGFAYADVGGDADFVWIGDAGGADCSGGGHGGHGGDCGSSGGGH